MLELVDVLTLSALIYIAVMLSFGIAALIEIKNTLKLILQGGDTWSS